MPSENVVYDRYPPHPAIDEEVGLNLNDEVFADFEGNPAIVASSTSPIDEPATNE